MEKNRRGKKGGNKGEEGTANRIYGSKDGMITFAKKTTTKGPVIITEPLELTGAHGGIRTPDPLFRRQLRGPPAL